tara:strand:+ start:11043 stop:11561 length:519 start_codon:yes stop_codon:yes gene_type:complete
LSVAYNFSEITLFIVEENPFLREMLSDLLKQFKPKRIYTESKCDIAVERIAEIMPDIIFASWTPMSDIIHLFKNIRHSPNENLSEIPIIAITSYTEKKYVIAARDLGMSEYLALPLSAKSIYARICKLIENPRQFVRSENYCGPDRRVKKIVFPGEDRRKQSEESEKSEDGE